MRLENHPICPFEARGIDGAIDHTIDMTDGLWIIECKDITKAKDVKGAWKEVDKLLNNNLTAGDKCAKQYQPWRDTDKPIMRYWLTLGCRLAKQSDCTELENTIKDTFVQLSTHPGLAHLAEIAVAVKPWQQLADMACHYANLCFKWFPSVLNTHFSTLIHKPAKNNDFRVYLKENKLLQKFLMQKPINPGDGPLEKAFT